MVWIFAQPVSMAYLLVLGIGIAITGFFWKIVPLPTFLGINFNFLIMLLLPNQVARWYTEKEFEGKSGWAYLKDAYVYIKDFVLDSRPIVAFERVKEIEEFSFRR